MKRQYDWRSGVAFLGGMLMLVACAAKQGPIVQMELSKVFVINALKGPRPSFRTSLDSAKASGVNTIVVKIENASEQPRLDLVELEVKEILMRHGFTEEQYSIVRCPQACPP